MALTEEAEDIRASQDVGDNTQVNPPAEESWQDPTPSSSNSIMRRRPFIASVVEITTAFENIVTLRYSQPTHLSGEAIVGCRFIHTDCAS
jgi:cleavage and polyadenylation specificity factor subunit 2